MARGRGDLLRSTRWTDDSCFPHAPPLNIRWRTKQPSMWKTPPWTYLGWQPGPSLCRSLKKRHNEHQQTIYGCQVFAGKSHFCGLVANAWVLLKWSKSQCFRYLCVLLQESAVHFLASSLRTKTEVDFQVREYRDLGSWRKWSWFW